MLFKNQQNQLLCITEAPTISEKGPGRVPEKYNFAEKFDVPPFRVKKDELIKMSKDELQREYKKDCSGQPLSRREKGYVNAAFKYKGKPWEIMYVLISSKHDMKNVDNTLSFSQMTEQTNIKAMSVGAGSATMHAEDWKPFTTEKLRQHFSVYAARAYTPPPPSQCGV